MDHGRGKKKERIPGGSAEISIEDVSNNDNIKPKGATEEQIQKMQAKADVISKLQRDFKQDIQGFKINHPVNCGINSDMVNTWTGNWAPFTAAAAPDHGVHGKLLFCKPSHDKNDMVNSWTGKLALHVAAAPNQVVQAHNSGKKQQVGGATAWKRAPPEHDEPHTKVTRQSLLYHWNRWTKQEPDECLSQPDTDQDQGGAPRVVKKENF